MPIIELSYETGTIQPEAKEQIAAKLTDSLMEIEGTKGLPAFASATWMVFDELAPKSMAVGGTLNIAAPVYKLVVNLPEGALNEARKLALVQRLTSDLLALLGIEASAAGASRVYCLLNDIKDGSWGFAGNVFTLAQIRSLR